MDMALTGAHTPGQNQSPLVAFVMPAHGHPVLMTEALESLLAQTTTIGFRIVVVADGCVLEETDGVCEAYALANPGLIYLRQPNGGPGSARNLGINFALDAWPGLQAIFFIDADNRLAPTALEDAWAALQAKPEAGWVYTDIDCFGIDWSGNFTVPYSPLLHVVHDNICDTGSLIRRTVFEAGVRFDEDPRAGFEDWDFFLQALGLGFTGQAARFGFSYRQRPESRFRAANRSRAATLDYLRSRHSDISCAASLLTFEHEKDPRYALRLVESGRILRFTDPARPLVERGPQDFAARFWAAVAEPDIFPLAPFFAWGSGAMLTALSKLKLLHGMFWLMERSCGEARFVALTLRESTEEISVTIAPPNQPETLAKRAVLWMAGNAEIKRLALDPKASLGSFDDAIEIVLSGPGLGAPSIPPSLPSLWSGLAALRESPLATSTPKRWTWRHPRMPARDQYVEKLRAYLGAETIMPRLPVKDQLDIGVVLPIASFGGAEKVAYAMARNLLQNGARVHLFITGPASLACLGDTAKNFDTISFLADPEVPIWGGPSMAFGQGFYLPDSPQLKPERLLGLLTGLDVVINCHSAAMNGIMGALRRQGSSTATYLHVTDVSSRGRPMGHTYLTLAFEHAYDRILTCSHRLADEMHALGVPADKLMPIPNAAGFTPSAEAVEAAKAARARERGDRPLNILYIGRLDPQKGVERLYALARDANAAALPVSLRVVGAALFNEIDGGWAEEFLKLDVTVQAPVYDPAELAACFAWADVLILPSRWEGAPLVIAECQSLGCIPLATDVGAVSEMLTDGVDGLLVPSTDDQETAAAMLTGLRRLLADDGLRQTLALNGLARSAMRSWDANFAPLRDWIGL